MKATKYFTSAAIAASFALALPACKKGGDGKNGDGGTKPAPAKADTHESLAGEAIGLMGSFADTLASAKDAASATTAAGKFDGIATKFEALAERMKTLGEPTGAAKEKIEGMFKAQETALEEKMGGVMATLLGNEEVGEILQPAMGAFQVRMEKLDSVMEAWAGKGGGDEPPVPDPIPAPDLIPEPAPVPDLIPEPAPVPDLIPEPVPVPEPAPAPPVE